MPMTTVETRTHENTKARKRKRSVFLFDRETLVFFVVSWFRGFVLKAVGACAAVGVLLSAQAPRAVDPAKEKRLEWFREAKYGLFIHWGLYAIPAGEWNGQRSLGLGEWIMFRSRIPVREYETLASRFNPVRYKADEWVTLAKDAGMKYIVI